MPSKKSINSNLLPFESKRQVWSERFATINMGRISNLFKQRQLLIQKVENTFKKNFTILTRPISLILLFIFIITLLLFVGFYNLLKRLEYVENELFNSQSSINTPKNTDSIKSYKNTLEINQFAGNKGVIDFGSKIKVNGDSIQTIDSPNCKINDLPPVENNCFLTFSPSLTGLSKSTTLFTGISFEGNLDGDNIISLELVDNIKGDPQGEKIVIDKYNFNKVNLLPLDIASNYSIRMTFWQKSDNIKISKINLYYINIEDMTQVYGKVSGLNQVEKYTTAIFLDTDNDKKLSPGDIKWSCNSFHPGVSGFLLQSAGDFSLSRDSECFTKARPDKWSAAGTGAALPIGNWLLVVYDKNSQFQSFSFSIETTDKPTILDLLYTQN